MYASSPLILKAGTTFFRLEHSVKQALQEGVHPVSEVPVNNVGGADDGLASSGGGVGMSRRHRVVEIFPVVVCRRGSDGDGSTTLRHKRGLELLLSRVPVRVGSRDGGDLAQHALHEGRSFGAAIPKHALEVVYGECGVTFVGLDVNIRLEE